MFGFVKKSFFVGLTILSSFTTVNSLSYISMNNQECKARPQVVNVNGDEPVFFFHLVWKQVNALIVVIICWNNDKFRCECKELVDNGLCDKEFIWNPSNYECECDKACDVSEYLDHEICKCWKKLVDKLVDECDGTVEEVKLAKITLSKNENKYKFNSCTLYIVLFSILFSN